MLKKYMDMLHQEDIQAVSMSTFSTIYKHLSVDTSVQKYLEFQIPIKYIRAMAQLRTSNRHVLKFTYNGITYHIRPSEICTICNTNKLETLEHLLFECPIYSSMKPVNMAPLNNCTNLIGCLNNTWPFTFQRCPDSTTDVVDERDQHVWANEGPIQSIIREKDISYFY
uniref:Uncharacterized protein LOC114331447 n=1 Tax=Diabrotica virgifera virgifera TaxID=50390 RepID=A0A6P7FLD7_DIAVI